MIREVFYVPSPERRARAIKALISSAQENIVMQMYLFAGSGELQTLQPVDCSPWASTVADWLIQKKRERPGIKIIVILDSQTISESRHTVSRKSPLTRHRLEEAGIPVLTASLAKTVFLTRTGSNRDPFWADSSRQFEKKHYATLQRRWQTSHNVEDHRKNLVIDSGRAGIVFSHNLIDQARLWQENTLLIHGRSAEHLFGLALDAVNAAFQLPVAFTTEEEAIRPWAAEQRAALSVSSGGTAVGQKPEVPVEILDGGPAIRQAILERLESTRGGQIRVASAYYSDLESLERLIDVTRRSNLSESDPSRLQDTTLRIRILIDNCHALALPRLLHFLLTNTVNLLCIHRCRQAPELELRIFPSRHKEMMHMKAIAWSDNPCLIAGQANFTPNSFSGAWLETSVQIKQPRIVRQFERHFDELWARAHPVLRYSQMNLVTRMKHCLHAAIFLSLVRLAGWFGFRY